MCHDPNPNHEFRLDRHANTELVLNANMNQLKTCIRFFTSIYIYGYNYIRYIKYENINYIPSNWQ